jgi:hypothetical protein
MESTSPSLQRGILRLLQTNGQMERSALGLRSRSTDPDNWGAVIDDLVARGLITESSEIRVGAKSYRGQKRAVIVYRLVPIADDPTQSGDHKFPIFADMSSEEVHNWVELFPRPAEDQSIAS